MSLLRNQPRVVYQARGISSAEAPCTADGATRDGGTPTCQPAKPRSDSGLLSLSTVAGHYRIAADPFQLAHDLGLGTRAADGEDIVRAAKRIGLKARLLKGQKVKRLAAVPMPAILRMKDGAYRIPRPASA